MALTSFIIKSLQADFDRGSGYVAWWYGLLKGPLAQVHCKEEHFDVLQGPITTIMRTKVWNLDD